MKHFPGIGLAASNTDTSVVVIGASASRLEPGLAPYRAAIAEGIPLIMLSNAVYTAYDPDHAASWSAPIAGGLLRERLGFGGVTITDSLDGIANARGVETTDLALLAAAADVDLVLTTGSEPVTARIHAALLGAALDGRLPQASLEASYARILALKAGR
jgi:beta-N-acetylhexosaminidase